MTKQENDASNLNVSDYQNDILETDRSGLSLKDKYIRLKQVLERSCKDITTNESLQFPSLFSRLVFISQKYDLPKILERQLQNLRIKANRLTRDEKKQISEKEYESAKEAFENFLAYMEGEIRKFDYVENTILEDEYLNEENLSKDKIRVQVLNIDRKNKIILGKAEKQPDKTLKIKYDVSSVNDAFNESIDCLWIGAQLNLIDAKEDSLGYLIPQFLVFEPDYLIDASAIAECFQSYGDSYLHYFRRKFEPTVNSHYILLGNLANFFLDELVYSQDAGNLDFETVFMKSFLSMPFEYASCKEIEENSAFKDFMQRAKSQFENIKRVVLYDMPANGFDPATCTLEPSFFSEKYGFQGRLDLLQLPDEEESGTSRIIELKSGKPPYPREDVTKVAPNHEVQTTVYRLMIQSVFAKDARDIYPTILYSSAENAGENLRFSAIYKQLEKEIINTRNLIIAAEHNLYTGNTQAIETFIQKVFDADSYGRTPQFFVDKLERLNKVLRTSSRLESDYFYRFISFISRELYLLKTGDEGFNNTISVSALWNSTFEERKEALELIDNLEIENIDSEGRDMVICFRRNNRNECINFREGEICILYPREKQQDSVLTNQILKGTVVKITAEKVLLRFRYKQRNLTFFSKYNYWVVEHDKLDHSYNGMFRSLFAFLSSTQIKKNLLLGLSEPEYKKEVESTGYENTNIQQNILNKALSAQDYFLIVGPPGTGKTSIFARQLIELLHKEEHTNILIMAYTNRAVDELCAAICNAFGEEEESCKKYIRIGSELSCDINFRHRLLQNISHQAKSRKDLLATINNTRIFAGTLASILGKPELFEIKKFNIAIIDEASQILEPQIIGLLPLFDKFIMIGDHKQLSTITLQNTYQSKVEEDDLNNIELYDCRESLFERLFRICKKEGWTHAFDTLSYHGRMHEEIARLVNKSFYNNILKPATERQIVPLSTPIYNKSDKFQSLVATNRVAFIPVRTSENINSSDKLNKAEADIVISLITAIQNIYQQNGRVFESDKTVGIITPYRNQIALIKQKLEETGIPELNEIMVDTIERYQGSQRDIIILSFCFNKTYQLKYFSNMNREGTVDRKLNVALTRAREQLFVTGNDYILKQYPIYRDMIDRMPICDL